MESATNAATLAEAHCQMNSPRYLPDLKTMQAHTSAFTKQLRKACCNGMHPRGFL
jgi:hypothetical protein